MADICGACDRPFDGPAPSGLATCVNKHGGDYDQKAKVKAAKPKLTATELAARPAPPAPKKKRAKPKPRAKKKAAPTTKFRGKTAIELDRDGNRARVFHRSQSGWVAWTHPYDERCEEACPQ